MKRKIKTILLSMLCAACRQAPLYVGAVDLPFVPVEESQAESTAAVSETPAVTEKPAEQETTVMTAAKTDETTIAPASETNAASNEGCLRIDCFGE